MKDKYQLISARKALVALLGFVIFVVFPSIILSRVQIPRAPILSFILAYFKTFALIGFSAYILELLSDRRMIKLFASFAISAYYLKVFISCAYALYMHSTLDFKFAMEALPQVLPTIMRMFGMLRGSLLILLFFAAWAAIIASWSMGIRSLAPTRTPRFVEKIKGKIKEYWPVAFGLFVSVVTPTLLVVLGGSTGASAFRYFAQYLFVFTCIVIAGLCASLIRNRYINFIYIVLIANYYVGVNALLFYRAYLEGDPSVSWISSILQDSYSSIFGTSQILALSTAATLILLPELAFLELWKKVLIRVKAPHAALLASLFIAILFAHKPLSQISLLSVQHATAAYQMNIHNAAGGNSSIDSRSKDMYPYIPTFDIPKHLSGENLFFLQIESGNALAAEGDAVVDGKAYTGNFMPYLQKITNDYGVFFPHFWGNGVHTVRGQEAILCGLAGNIQRAVAWDLKNIKQPCLPKLLAKDGYTSLFFGSIDDPGFDNGENFFKKIGFDEVHYTDIMKEGDLDYYWGYDDAIFYQRVFEYLQEHYPNPKKLFVYFQVSAHHAGFPQKEEYRFLNAFNPPREYIEWYLNSYKMQDYNTEKFLERYQKYVPDDSNLFIMPDHSWPVGINGSTDNAVGANTDNFLIHLSYFPPPSRADDYKVGQNVSQKFSQANFIDTVFEILSEKPRIDSFAFAMRKNGKIDPLYEDCELLAQPYNGPQLAVVKNQKDYYLYSVPEKTVSYFDLKKDLLTLHPKVLEENVSMEKFNSKYNCRKYWQNYRTDW